ncbi:MAG: tetratricopeptide repeat protein, partial [Pseudomonadota bacterium]
QTDSAGEYYAEAMRIYIQLDEHKGQARTFERLGSLKVKQDHPDQALLFFQKGLELCRTHEDGIGALYFLDQIIPLLKARGQVDQILTAYRESVTRAEKLGDRERMALGLVGLADVYQRTGKPEEAVPYLALAHDLYLRLSKPYEAGLIRGELEKLGLPPDQSGRPQ